MLDESCLLVLSRSDAKTFFATRTDDDRLSLVRDLVGRDHVRSAPCGDSWEAIHEAMTAIELPDSALSQCILGGRPMHGGQFHIVMVRPDVVRLVAQQLANVNEAQFREAWTEDQVEQAWALCQQIAELYRNAAENQGAVVFAARKPEP